MDMLKSFLGAVHQLLLWLPSISYGPPKENPAWGPITATINWCEEDYYMTRYCAEFINTLTNLIFIGLAIKGMRNVLREGHDKIFFVAFAGYCCVGIGSFLFHATLWYSMQLVDELSMLYATSIMMWASLTHGRSLRYSVICGVLLTSLALGVSVIYHHLQDPVFHQNAFALLTIVVLFRSFFLMELHIRPKDPACVNSMWLMVGTGIGVFLLGFGVWNLDNIYCRDIRAWRKDIGMPWAFVAEGHGWWHLLTGIGAYYELQYGIYLRHCLDGRQAVYKLHWPRLWSLPEVRRWKSGERERVLKDEERGRRRSPNRVEKGEKVLGEVKGNGNGNLVNGSRNGNVNGNGNGAAKKKA
ncbi:ceramidase-domain-containing protein [Pyronema omphalodes]|nr:ceramidase-domain-containing protein [Pyronema omphalodes]